MTILELAEVLRSTELPVAYYQFHEPPTVPFLVYWLPDSDDFFADNQNYQRKRAVQIELYADRKDFELENRIESVLRSSNLTFKVNETYIESEHLYQVLYGTEVIVNE